MKDPEPPVSVGQVIDGKFRVERVLGAGGMGVVVAASHLKLDKIVALKFLHPEVCASRESVNRFLREGQALARITSVNVARVMDVGTLEDGAPYLVMEYLEGSDLGATLKRQGRLPIEEAVGYLLQACEAVAEAHANGIIHRDLKPSNLFLTRSAHGAALVKVLDFGISKAMIQRQPQGAPSDSSETTAPAGPDTITGALVGSPSYMSPEQIRNARRVDERTDVWSLGVILYEFLCGQPPFEAEMVSGTLAAVCADPPKPMADFGLEIPPELERVILRCLEKTPERRYESVAELARGLLPFAPPEGAAAVDRIARVLGTSTPAPTRVPASSSDDPNGSTGSTLRSWEGDTVPVTALTARRRRWLIGAASIATLVGIAGALLKGQSEDARPSTTIGATAATPHPPSALPTAAVPVAPVEPTSEVLGSAAPSRVQALSAEPAPSASPPPAPRGTPPKKRVAPVQKDTATPTPPPNGPDGTEDRK